MTLATSFISRINLVFRKPASEQPDYFDARLQKLAAAKLRECKHSQSVFKSRQQRLAA